MKQLPIPTLIGKSIENKAMCSVKKLHLCLLSSLVEVILDNFTSSTFSIHFSTSLSTIFFIHLSFISLNTYRHHMIYHIHTYNYLDSE